LPEPGAPNRLAPPHGAIARARSGIAPKRTPLAWRNALRKKRVARRISPERRARILSTAGKLGLTAEEVERRFGVSKWTFTAWRKGAKRGRGRAAGAKPRAGAPRSDAKASPPPDVGAEIRLLP